MARELCGGMLKLGFAYALALGIALASTSSCSSVEHAYDCNQICGRYQECFDASYDTGTCESRCRDHASDDNDYGNHAESCQSCIDDRSCAGATFACASECAGIVP
jgi:hypothetical protein